MDDDQIDFDDDHVRIERLSRRDRSSVPIYGYTRFIRIMRLLLPLAAMGIVAVLFLRIGVQDTLIAPTAKDPSLAQQEPRIAQNELLNPKFESVDKKNNPYRITADRALQGEVNEDLIMLERPVGVMMLADGVEIRMRSETGAYRQDTERFFLQGDVFLEYADAYHLQSEEAHIDLKQRFAWSQKDVKGYGPDLTIIAKGVRADAVTGEIIFNGPATLILKNGLGGTK